MEDKSADVEKQGKEIEDKSNDVEMAELNGNGDGLLSDALLTHLDTYSDLLQYQPSLRNINFTTSDLDHADRQKMRSLFETIHVSNKIHQEQFRRLVWEMNGKHKHFLIIC